MGEVLAPVPAFTEGDEEEAGEGMALPRIRQLVSPFMANKDMEMQQRAIEFSQLLAKQNLWAEVLAPVPAFTEGDEEEAGEGMALPSASAAAAPNMGEPAPAASDGLDDMLG